MLSNRAALAALVFLCLQCCLSTGPICAADQQPPPDPLKALQDQIDDLKRTIEKQQEQIGAAIRIAGRPKANDLNMAIGAAVDTSYSYYDGTPATHDRAAGSDFALRGAELVAYADVDPFFKTYIVLSASGDAANNDEATAGIEEAAFYTTCLPVISIKAGRFFVPFGRLSLVHDHDLPFTTRPPSLDTYVGGESGGDGAQIQAVLPIDHYCQFNFGVFNKLGAEFTLQNAPPNFRRGAELTFFGKALTTFDLCTDADGGSDHELELGFSAIETPDHDIHRDLINFEATYKYHPAGKLRQRLIWSAEIMRNSLETNTGTGLVRRTGFGGYTYIEFFLDQHWSCGPRADIFENVDPTLDIDHRLEKTKTWTGFITYNFSEFSRLRLEYDRHEYPGGEHANEILLQATVFWGAHTHSFDQR